MSSPSEIAAGHYQERQQLAIAAAEVALGEWAKVDRNKIAASWLARIPFLGAIVAAAQLGAARQAEPYVAQASAAQGLAGPVEALLSAAAFAGIASDGRELLNLLFQPAIAALTALGGGASIDKAMATGHANLDMIVRTQVADAGRAADQVAMTAQPNVDTYTRVVVGKTCNRCIILAGRTYTYSEGFERHPRCDCQMLGTSQALAAGLVQDPQAIYESMTKEERTAAGWTASEQDAINEGADIVQVTNATNRTSRKKSLYTAGGREFTKEGTSRSGLFGGFDIDPETGKTVRRSREAGRKRAGRLTVDQIYAEAKSRDEALRLLRENAYLLGETKKADKDTDAPADADVDAETRAVDRQAAIDRAKAQAEMLAELEEIAVINETDGDALARQARQAAARFGVADDPVFAGILRHAEAGNADLVEASIETIAERLGLTRIGGDLQSLQVVRFDRTQHTMLAGEKPTQFVEVVRPGYVVDLDGERLTLIRATVAPSDRSPVAAARPRKPVTGAKALDAVPVSMLDESLSSNQRSLLGQYKGYAYLNINGPLDRQKGEIPRRHFGFAYVREFLDEVDPIMDRSRLKDDIEVLRGISKGQTVFGDGWSGNLTGTEWVTHRFQSTSADRATAEGFVEDDGALLVMRVPKGVGGIQLSDAKYESELLLQRGLTQRVTSDTGPGPNRVIHVDVVPAGPTPVDTMTVPQLRALAKDRRIKVPSGARKADIVKLLDKPPADTVVDLAKMTVPQLKALAGERGVKILSKDRKSDIIAKLESRPQTKTQTAEPDPGAAAAIVHVNELIDAGIPEALRGSVAGALDVQAALTPKAAKHLKKVAVPKTGSVWGDHFEFKDPDAFALYVKNQKQLYLNHVWTVDQAKSHGATADGFKADVRQSQQSGWFTPTGVDDELGHICSHEYGHHVAFMFTKINAADGVYESYLDADVAGRLLPLMNEALGLVSSKGGKSLLPVQGGKVRGASLKAWIAANQATIDRRVSRYGGSNFDELLAEIWQEYSTMGDRARPGIRRIGELMRELAEEAA